MQQQSKFRSYLRDKKYEKEEDLHLQGKCRILNYLFAVSGSLMGLSFALMFGAMLVLELMHKY